MPFFLVRAELARVQPPWSVEMKVIRSLSASTVSRVPLQGCRGLWGDGEASIHRVMPGDACNSASRQPQVLASKHTSAPSPHR